MAGSRGEACSWLGWAKLAEPSPGVVVLSPAEHCGPKQWCDSAQGFPGVEVVLPAATSDISPQHPT